MNNSDFKPNPDVRSDRNHLTERELEVLFALSRGLGNGEIAASLKISENTTKAHLRTIFMKLNVSNRVEAVNAFYRMERESNPPTGMVS